jgi:hypothetical protein
MKWWHYTEATERSSMDGDDDGGGSSPSMTTVAFPFIHGSRRGRQARHKPPQHFEEKKEE